MAALNKFILFCLAGKQIGEHTLNQELCLSCQKRGSMLWKSTSEVLVAVTLAFVYGTGINFS
jgi:hypothetical protein